MSDNFDAIKQIHENQENDVTSSPEEPKNTEASEEILEEKTSVKTSKNNIFRKLKGQIKSLKISSIFKKFNNKNVWLIFILLLLICLCQYFFFNNKYELVSRDGQTYRLNKINGKIALLQNTRLVSIDEPKNTDELMMNKTKVWKPCHIPQLDGIDVGLMTKWMDGKLYYQIDVTPYTKRLKNMKNNPYDNLYNSLTIKFQDELGFDLLKVTIPLISMTGETGNNGKIEALAKNDNISCPFDVFKNIKSFDVEWNF